MTADLTGKLPIGTRKIRITTNLQIYWDSILIDRTTQGATREIPFDELRAGFRPVGKTRGFRMTPADGIPLTDGKACV